MKTITKDQVKTIFEVAGLINANNDVIIRVASDIAAKTAIYDPVKAIRESTVIAAILAGASLLEHDLKDTPETVTSDQIFVSKSVLKLFVDFSSQITQAEASKFADKEWTSIEKKFDEGDLSALAMVFNQSKASEEACKNLMDKFERAFILYRELCE